jgi:putative membrane protein
MKNLHHFYSGLVLIFFFLSCNNGSPDSVKSAKDSNEARIDSLQAGVQPGDSLVAIPPKSDADFLVTAASGSMMEVQLGRLAQSHSRDKRVKAFGAMMIKDHEAGGRKLKTLASGKNLMLPDSVSNSQQKEIDNLKKKDGVDFDKAYILLMVNDHKDDINEFEKQAKKTTDPQLTSFVNSSLEILRKHLDSANSLRRMLGITDVPTTIEK